jgi:hypothetical protein
MAGHLMGGSNVIAVMRLYAGKVPPTALNLLAYMAAVSIDKDAEPSWWEGHDMLALRGLGRQLPSSEEAAKSKECARARAAGLRAVERGITSLFAAGAITTSRHASGHPGRIRTVRYRLWITQPAPDGKRRKQAAQHPTENVGHDASTRRKVVPTPDGNRRTKEEEEELKQERDNSAAAFELTNVEGNQARSGQDQIELEAADRKRQLAERLAAYTTRPGPDLAGEQP